MIEISLYRGKIYCAKCGKKMKYKKRAKKPIYVCSTYDNYGAKACIRNHTSEQDITWFVYGHFDMKEDEVTAEFINDNIYKITIDNFEIRIVYKNGEESYLSANGMER